MAVIRAQVVFNHASGLARDRVVNTFHFNGVADGVVGAAIADALYAFYQTPTAAGQKVGGYLSSVLVNFDTKLYDVTTEPSGPPFYVRSGQFMGSRLGTGNLPSEVAMCLSFEGIPTTGLVQTRRRGRVFIGPLRNDTIAEGDGGVPRPTPTFGLVCRQAAQRMATAVDPSCEWVIYSRPYAGRDAIVRPGRTTLPAIAARPGTTVDIGRCWTDDAFDTQRRRGERPTGRGAIAVTD